MSELAKMKNALSLYATLEYAGDPAQEIAWIEANAYLTKAIKRLELVEKYAKHLAKKYPEYHKQQFEGKNGADSDNEKGYWRGMADSVLAILTDWKHHGLIAHTGLYGDDWPKEEGNTK